MRQNRALWTDQWLPKLRQRNQRRDGPSTAPPPTDSPAREDVGDAGPSGHILVVEDDPSLCSTVSSFLRDEGYRVSTARTGVEALESIERDRPSMILLDIHLPVMDGAALKKELNARGISIPLIVMTGASDAYQWAVEIGAAAYVAKPLSLPSLIRRVETLEAEAGGPED